MLSVDVNQNIEKYQESVVAGMNFRETITAIIAVFVGTSIILLCVFLFKIPLIFSVYLSFPFMVPVVLTGFGKKNGMSYFYRFKQAYLIKDKSHSFNSLPSKNVLSFEKSSNPLRKELIMISILTTIVIFTIIVSIVFFKL